MRYSRSCRPVESCRRLAQESQPASRRTPRCLGLLRLSTDSRGGCSSFSFHRLNSAGGVSAWTGLPDDEAKSCLNYNCTVRTRNLPRKEFTLLADLGFCT